jgi:hypothetical protein
MASANTTRRNGRINPGIIIIILSHFYPTKRSTGILKVTRKTGMDPRISKSGKARRTPRTTKGISRMPKISITGGTLILKNLRMTISGTGSCTTRRPDLTEIE